MNYGSPKLPLTYTYMLQRVDYSNVKLLQWMSRDVGLRRVQRRGSLDFTSRAVAILLASYTGLLLPIPVSIYLSIQHTVGALAWLLLLTAPLTSLIMCLAVNGLAHAIVTPINFIKVKMAKKTLDQIPAKRIALLGSYGKTTIKELLDTVFSGELKVAATPKNQNVLISHAKWANGLSGDEKLLLVEYGEYRPGDIGRLAEFSQPDIAIITGLSPAHMDTYGSLSAIAQDFASITKYTTTPPIVNGDAGDMLELITDAIKYDQAGVGDWKISDIKSSIRGMSFTMYCGSKELNITTKLIGEHLVGPLAAVAMIAERFGLAHNVIERNIAKTKPFPHRMQPSLINGAWVIDDTYNGNIEGMRAGLKLLSDLTAQRKTYVTPGLVEQGDQTKNIHTELGKLIAEAKPDRVVLMKNSVSSYIQAALEQSGYKGSLDIINNPLEYYTNLEYYVSQGDLVLMQNDWPDGYV
jgi:UDP-N-acetylmuramoyl-tripeptide--D-alanyl-D-alanine ligase